MQIADTWFQRRQMDDGITWIYEPHVHPFIRCNVWHVPGRDRDLLVDTALGILSLREAVQDLLQKPVIAAASHTHFDHVGAHHEFEERLVHSAEAATMAEAGREMVLRVSSFGAGKAEALEASGYVLPEDGEFLTALPFHGFDPGAHVLQPAVPTWVVEEGDVVDLGDRIRLQPCANDWNIDSRIGQESNNTHGFLIEAQLIQDHRAQRNVVLCSHLRHRGPRGGTPEKTYGVNRGVSRFQPK